MARASLLYRRFSLFAILFMVAALAIQGCGTLSAAPAEAPPSSNDEGDVNEPPGESNDLEPVALACPPKRTEMVLFVSHTFDWSANRDTDRFLVKGSTEPSSPCPITLEGSQVNAPSCRVPYTNSGQIQTDAGPCELDGQGTAVLEFEGSCKDGIVTLTITEFPDPDVGLTGALNCRGASEPYLTFYPPSITTREFHLKVGGVEATEDADPDLSGQFSYHKSWTLRSPDLISP